MRWNWDERPFRPVSKHIGRGEDGVGTETQPDAFMDRKGRIWYADTEFLISSLPGNPESHETIPSDFHRPDPDEDRRSKAAHAIAKRKQEDERAERWHLQPA